MGFGEAIRTCFGKYAAFRGRATRSEYWFFILFCLLAGVAAAILDALMDPGGRIQPISGIVSLALLIPQMAVLVRRLHDTDHSGWWVGGLYLYLVLGMIVVVAGVLTLKSVGAAGAGGILLVLLALGFLAYGTWLFVLTVLKGTDGTNAYGPDPFAQPADVF
jgi:uncharacterized membrane protein YhaH (DUF805 family)